MTDQKCRVCKDINRHSKIFAREMFLGTKDIFEYVFCGSCGSLSIKTIPNNIDQYYKNYYSLDSESNYSENWIRNVLKKGLVKAPFGTLRHKIYASLLCTQNDLRLKAFAQCDLRKNDAILDVGCGSGDFLKELFFLGYRNLVGIDAFLEKDKSTNERINIYKKSIFDIDGKFKLIMFHHSLEHMDNLSEVLTRVYELLDDQGICLIRIPHIESFSFRKFQGNWFSIHAPFHYTLPSLEGMKLIAKDANLSIQKNMGEQLYYFFLLSSNHALGITDYDSRGIRKHFESKRVLVRKPPLYTSAEIRYWKNKTKAILGSGMEDWMAYFLVKNKT